ncbi:MAG TPA: RsmE family RNA methyltransferase [Acidimicrobiia bacterium]|nr:RsmE family RNA methyltransferase [Acidimicrobiia bacterium]
MQSAFCADANAVAHTFVPALDDEVEISGADLHHLVRVRRLRAGESVTAADGAGVWRPYVVTDAGRRELRLEACGAIAAEPELTPRLVVAFALTKGGKPELVVQKVTELGADEVIPVHTRRSVVRWEGGRGDTAVERLRRVAGEAARQCRRARLPVVGPPVDLVSLAGRPGLLVAERDGTAVTDLAEPRDGEWVLVVGPEGGFEPGERDTLAGAAGLALGPHVLRAETAAVAGAAALAGRRRSR